MNVITLDLIKGAARLINVIASGEPLNPSDAQDGLQALNEMLEEWSTESLSVWGSVNNSFNMVPGTSTYTIGTGGTFNVDRPVRISDAFCRLNGVDFPVEIIDQTKYNLIGLKTQSGALVEQLLYVNDNPLGQIFLWPVPTQVGPLVLSLDRIIASIANLANTINWPPLYAKALRYNLAVALAGEYGTDAPNDVKEIAKQTRKKIKAANQTKAQARFNIPGVGDGPANWQRGY
jgi:hypothetical protein